MRRGRARLGSARAAMRIWGNPVMRRERARLRSARPAIPAGRIPAMHRGWVRLRSVRLAIPGVMISVTGPGVVAGRSAPLTMPTRRTPAERRGWAHHGPGRSRAVLSSGSRAGLRGGTARRRTRCRMSPSRPAAPMSADPRPRARGEIVPDTCQAPLREMVRPLRVSPRTGGLSRSVRGGSPAPARRMVPVPLGVQRPVPAPRTTLRETPIPGRRARVAGGRARGRPCLVA